MISTRVIINPPNPWHSLDAQWLPDQADLPPQLAHTRIFEEQCRSIVTKNDSPDMGLSYSMNPYRGCAHACAYCYARPSHQYLDFGAGTDFETQLIVKVNAVEKLRETFEKKSWQGDTIMLSGNTDCYQPLEASYQLTRRCLEVFLNYRNPVAMITKSCLVRRDASMLAELAKVAPMHILISIPFWDETQAAAMEPGAPKPAARLETLRILAEAGIPAGIMIGPIIPGLNDSQVPSLLEKAAEAGASFATYTLLRLPAEVKDVFLNTLKQRLPSFEKKVLHAIRESRNGKLYDSRFGERHRGHGAQWQVTRQLFHLACKRLGLNRLERAQVVGNTFSRPGEQMALFEETKNKPTDNSIDTLAIALRRALPL